MAKRREDWANRGRIGPTEGIGPTGGRDWPMGVDFVQQGGGWTNGWRNVPTGGGGIGPTGGGWGQQGEGATGNRGEDWANREEENLGITG